MDLVSIIVPVYNVEPYLELCIQSIIHQTYQYIEILLIDDGSIDQSGSICDTWAEKDSRIQVLHKENGGLSDARNKGLKTSSGEWILFVDSDDWIHLNLIEKCLKAAHKFQADIVVFDFEKMEEDGTGELFSPELILWETCSGSKMLQEFMVNRKGYVMSWNKLYHRTIWDNISFPKGKIHEDEFVITDIYEKAKKVAITNQKLYYYRQRQGSIMNTRGLESYYHAMEAFGLRCEKLKNNNKVYFIAIKQCREKMTEVYQKEKNEDKKEKILYDMRDFLENCVRTVEKDFFNKESENNETLYFQVLEYYLEHMIELHDKKLKNREKTVLQHRFQEKMTPQVKRYFPWKRWILWKIFSINPLFYQLIIRFMGCGIYKKPRKLLGKLYRV